MTTMPCVSSGTRRPAWIRAALLLIAAVALTSCSPNTTDPPAVGTPTAAGTPAATSPTPTTTPSSAAPTATPTRLATPTPTAATTTAPPAADVTVDVVVADGKVTPNAKNVRVDRGKRVRFTIKSDVAESIHIHGYDLTAEARPGKPGAVTFLADQSGVFEVETHESARLVVKLIVS